ncbi:MAG: M20/M25/M40 family metallo-hydrolase [Pseudomonadota bacterium]
MSLHFTTLSLLLPVLASASPAAPSSAPAGDAVTQLTQAALSTNHAMQRLEVLVDDVGPRLAGSEGLSRAIAWAEGELQAEGLDVVRREAVKVPVWRRGEERASIVAPLKRSLHVVALGNSVATPARGVTAPLVVVRSFDELKARSAEAQGSIVLFQYDWPASLPPFEAYDAVYAFRSRGASEAARLGARAVLVRSPASRSLQSPHTGGVFYRDWAPKIPAASITVEDAAMLERLVRRHGQVRIQLVLRPTTAPDAPSANLVAEWRGREKPNEIVLIGAHLDSWDLSPGANDNGVGVVATMEVLSLLKRLDLRPRRTVRLVLFTNEENGMRGAYAYAEKHGTERHVAAIEADRGGGKPLGFTVEGGAEATVRVRELAAPLSSLGAAQVDEGFGGVDLLPLRDVRVLNIGLESDAARYFELHHSAADTLDTIDPQVLQQQVAALAVLTWQLAEDPREPPVVLEVKDDD